MLNKKSSHLVMFNSMELRLSFEQLFFGPALDLGLLADELNMNQNHCKLKKKWP